jgi:pyruvate formate lyase activating enzyme
MPEIQPENSDFRSPDYEWAHEPPSGTVQKALSLPGNTPLGTLIKTTLIDYPGRVAASLFLHGCNLRCPYCYNTDLVTGSFDAYRPVTAEELFAHLEKRRAVLTGFVISGGEPLISPWLEALITGAKDLGYQIKIDTNGTRPEELAKITGTEKFRPDFVAIDLKTAPSRYSELGWEEHMASSIRCSLKLIENMDKNIRREYRTVLVPGLVTREDIPEMASLLPRDASWKFAPFRPGTCVDPDLNEQVPYTEGEMQHLVAFAQEFIPGAELR